MPTKKGRERRARNTLEMFSGLTCAVYAYPSAWWMHGDQRGDSPRSHPDLPGANGNGSGQRLPVDRPAPTQSAALEALPERLQALLSQPVPR